MTPKLIILTILGTVVLATLAYMIVRAWRYRRNHPDEDPGTSRHPLLILLLLLASSGTLAQNGWTVQNLSGSTFTVSRTNTSVAETVLYRTVNISAYAGIHYTEATGSIDFGVGEPSKTVTVTELSPSSDNAYKYQTGTQRSYRFEVTDQGGFYLAHCDRTRNYGTQFNADKVNQSVTNLVYFSGSNYASGLSSSKYLDVAYTPSSGQVETSGTLQGYVLIDDSYDYAQKPATVSTSTLISSTGATASYLNTLKYKIYATVCFTEKEKDDGYQYLQIVAGDGNASYDTGYDPDGQVNNPVNSVYKTCFELSDGDNAEGKQFFPHRYSYANKSAETSAVIGITEFSQANGHLWQHKFKSGYQATNSGSLIFDPTVTNITTRFDAGGNNDDTWGYKDLFVRMTLVDASAPTKQDVTVAPGKHCKGNYVYVSVAFNEIVTVSGTPTLSTNNNNNWGSLSYIGGSGSNVLTFRGTISASASGSLIVTGLSGTVKDLAGNDFTWSGSHTLCPLDASYAWPITYDLDGGTASNPATYTWESATFTLTNPTRTGYIFDGWTGTGLNEPTMTVTIANHTHVPLSYTAHWYPLWGIDVDADADGSQAHPYLISTTRDLDTLAARVNRGTTYANTYFLQTADIVYDGTANNYTPVGTTDDAHAFGGLYDGGGHTVSGININISNSNIGLFGRLVSTATVQNLTLASTTITAIANVGGIVGNNEGGTVQNCRVEGTVYIYARTIGGTYPYRHGGIVGNTNGGTVQGCISAATVSGGSSAARYGGIVGNNQNANIVDCLFTGPTPTANSSIGSIAGIKEGTSTLTNNYYTVSTLGGVNSADIAGARHARTVTLGSNISLVGVENVYSNSGLTAIVTTALRLSDGTIYSGATQTLTLTHTGVIPTGYHIVYSYNDGSDHDLQSNTFSMPDADITVSSSFVADIYTITCDLGGGSVATPNPTTYTIETADFTLNNPTREGYTFAGWTGTGLDAATQTVTVAQGSNGDRSYTATWTPIVYTISYDLAGGSASNPTSYTIETATFTLTNPTRDGYTFLGWTGTDLDAATENVTITQGSIGNRSYTATWATGYTITYDLAGGSVATPNPLYYAAESNDITLVNPTREGYTFTGWTGTGLASPTMSVTIAHGSTGDRSYTATWTLTVYTISYNLGGGSVATPNPADYTIESDDITLVNPTREGCTFAGWTGTGLASPTMSVTVAQGSTGDRSYTATWTPIVYTITYDLDGGSVATPNPVTYTVESATFTLVNPTREGYTFLGWIGTGLNELTSSVTISQGSTGDRSYTAMWISYWGIQNGANGTAEHPYQIASTSDLDTLAARVNRGNNYANTYFCQTDDIAYTHTSQWNDNASTENNFTVIGTNGHSFSGIFDGCGHTVSGIRSYETTDYRGLFGYIGGGTVKNVTVSDSRITGHRDVGGIVGENYRGTVENCHATATVAIYTIGNSHSHHGGVVGYNDEATVEGCTSAATVVGSGGSYGGVVGYNDYGTVSRCLALGAIVANGDTWSNPIVGLNSYGTVTDCHYRHCTVEGSTQNDLYAIVAGTDVTLTPAGDTTASYLYGGLQLIGGGFFYGGTLYASEYATVGLTLAYSGNGSPDGFGVTVGALSGSANPYSLTVPNQDVTILPSFTQDIPYSYGFEEAEGWANWRSLSGDNSRVQGTNNHSGSYYLDTRGSTSNVVALPSFTAEANTLQLSFWTRPRAYNNMSSGTFSVGYLTDAGDAATFVALKTYSYSDWSSNVYRQKTVYFNNVPAGARIAFRHNPTYSSYYWYVDDVEVSLLPSCIPPDELAISDITTSSATFGWAEVTGAQWEYALVATDDPAQLPADNAYSATTAHSVTLGDLDDGTPYTFFLRRDCGGDKSEVVSVGFNTRQIPVAVPYADDFEQANRWLLENGDYTNRWVWGTAAHNGEGTHALYISNDGGTSNTYDNNSPATVFAHKAFTFEAGRYTFAYDWRAYGESSGDYLRVFLVPDDVVLSSLNISQNSLPSGCIALDGGSKLNRQSEWRRFSTANPVAIAAGQYKMVFAWKNDGSFGSNPPAAIDNVTIERTRIFTTAGHWNEPTNWSPAGVPAADETVYLAAAAVVPAGCVAVVDQVILDGGSLTLADGAQLVCNNNVRLTVQKQVGADQWNGISGLNGVGDLSSLTTGTAYDLFHYDEEHATWHNQKTDNDPYLGSYYGYIYRRADNATIDLATYNYCYDYGSYYYARCSDDALRGFNLIGNYCTHDVYFGTGITVEEGSLAPGFYTLNADGTWRAHTFADPIHVAQSFLIQATTDEIVLRFYNTAAAPGSKGMENGERRTENLAFTVKGNGHTDVAYALFADGEGLRKFGHLDADLPSLSIAQGGQRYAIATLSDTTEAFPLAFDGPAGEYTLSVGLMGEMGYCHLIDRVAGADVDLLRDSSYTFRATGSDVNRFLVKLSPDNTHSTHLSYFAHLDGDRLVITGTGTLQVFDVLGRSVFTKELSTANCQLSIHTFPSSGVYILRLGDKTQKVVIKR